MSESLLEDLQITVIKSTASDLRKMSEEYGMSIGEVVDRLMERFICEDPEAVVSLIAGEILVLTSKLSKENHSRVMREITEMLLMGFEPETMCELVEEAKRQQEDMIKQLSAFPQEQYVTTIEKLRALEELEERQRPGAP